jgi:hypothetical protein
LDVGAKKEEKKKNKIVPDLGILGGSHPFTLLENVKMAKKNHRRSAIDQSIIE